MQSNEFISIENIDMIWEIVFDDIKNSFSTQKQASHAKNFLITQSQVFFDREKNRGQDLIEMNKLFISQIMYSFHGLHEQQQQQQQGYRQYDEQPNSNLFTIEELHTQRLSSFEKTLAEKRNEFDKAMTLNIPPQPNFNDTKDEPIGNKMHDLIAQTVAQRNFDLEEIHKNTNTIINSTSDVNSWLNLNIENNKEKRVEEKRVEEKRVEEKKEYNYLHQQKPKLIQIGEPIKELGEKHISWGTNKEFEFIKEERREEWGEEGEEGEEKGVSDNIFSKLKRVVPDETIHGINELNKKMDILIETLNLVLEKLVKHV